MFLKLKTYCLRTVICIFTHTDFFITGKPPLQSTILVGPVFKPDDGLPISCAGEGKLIKHNISNNSKKAVRIIFVSQCLI